MLPAPSRHSPGGVTRPAPGTTLQEESTLAGEADRLTMSDPIACEILVQGVLAPHWSDRLGGLEITVCDRPQDGAGGTTELRGALPDQAALLGVLTSLYDLRLPLLAVACAPAPGQPTASASADARPLSGFAHHPDLQRLQEGEPPGGTANATSGAICYVRWRGARRVLGMDGRLRAHRRRLQRGRPRGSAARSGGPRRAS